MSPNSPIPIIPELPHSATENYEFRFVGEGASNVVFEVIVPPNDEHSSLFHGIAFHLFLQLP